MAIKNDCEKQKNKKNSGRKKPAQQDRPVKPIFSRRR